MGLMILQYDNKRTDGFPPQSLPIKAQAAVFFSALGVFIAGSVSNAAFPLAAARVFRQPFR